MQCADLLDHAHHNQTGAEQGAEQGAGQGAEQGATNICIPSGANMSDYVTCYHPNQTRPVHR